MALAAAASRTAKRVAACLIRRRRSLALLTLLAALAAGELSTSRLQALLFAHLASEATYDVAPGASPSIAFPGHGPYDARLGYVRLPSLIARLHAAGFQTDVQARWSGQLSRLARLGLAPVYRPKGQAGLQVVDATGHVLYSALYPERVYRDFSDIPPVVVETLLFIENRELLESSSPFANPAVEFDRLLRAVVDTGLHHTAGARPISGGSTLAVQLEKLRHSPGGRTGSVAEKGRQIASASLRAYLAGARTLPARQQLVVDYLNALPLAAIADHGEVSGLGDGLALWYGVDFAEANRVLARVDRDGVSRREAGATFRQTLSLLAAVKKPTTFLVANGAALERRVNAYLPALAEAGVIPAWLRDEALSARVARRQRAGPIAPRPADVRKAASAVRIDLLSALGLEDLPALDRLDLVVQTPLAVEVTRAVANALHRLGDCGHAAEAGIVGPRLLSGSGCDEVVYSFTLYERGPSGNLLRVQTDTYDGPLNINRGTRLELGSTAKLRTLVTYLELIAALHLRHADTPADVLWPMARRAPDPLTRWALEHLAAAPDRSLDTMLEAAMTRRYPASPGEAFFTGGGVHRFSNYDGRDNGRVITVREAFARSVNLVFIRLMRDVVTHLTYGSGELNGILDDSTHPARHRYLRRFAEWDGVTRLTRFYGRHARDPASAVPRHPLDEWLTRYLIAHPDASLDDVLETSAAAREEASGWLFATRHPRAQNRAIQIILEHDAFAHMQGLWQRLGYPFASLVPSYATAIGVSGDNPVALSELLGIIVNGGVRRPVQRFETLHFAAGTPYDTRLVRTAARDERVLAPEVAAVLRRELAGVVQHGSGRRLAGGVELEAGELMNVGGKTGTGDNRFETSSGSRVRNRTATFAFTIGDRFFGSVVAYVPGPGAARHRFTSSLALQVLKHVMPLLDPLLAAPAAAPAPRRVETD